MRVRHWRALGAGLGCLSVVGWAVAEAGEGTALERWFMPGPLGHEPGETPPPPGERAYLTRALGGVNRHDGGEWAEFNALTPRLAFSHNLSRVVPPELFATHPDYFPEIAGKRVLPRPGTWNPDLGNPAVAEHAARLAGAHFEAHPEALSFALGINDGLIFGESAETVRWTVPPRYFRQRPDYSDLIFNFMNEVAARIAPDWPDRHVGALAYYWAEKPPAFPVHPQVLPFLTADRSQGYDRDFWAEELANQRAWGQSGARRLGLYDYIYGVGFLFPRYHPHLLAEHLRHAREAGFTDYYAEMSPHWGLDGPQPWLVAQLLQDPTQDVAALLDEYFARYFRAAGPAMRGFYERCEALWLNQPGPSYWLKHFRNESQTALFPASVRQELRADLAAAAAAAQGDATVEARVALVEAAWGLSERLATYGEARDRLARLGLDGGGGEADTWREAWAWHDATRAEVQAYERWVRAAHPLALGPYGLADMLRHDAGPVARHHLRHAAGGREGEGAELLRTPGWEGVRGSAEVVAGLEYSPPVPFFWQSRSEPWEGLRTTWREGPEGTVLRLENHKLTRLWQWTAAPASGHLVARLDVRACLSPSALVVLVLDWLDEAQRPVGRTLDVRLPEGEWPEWVTLAADVSAPEGAAWVTALVWVAHLQPEDWVELRGISLRELDATVARRESR